MQYLLFTIIILLQVMQLIGKEKLTAYAEKAKVMLTRDSLDKEVRKVWQKEGRIAAIKFYKYYHDEIEVPLHEAKEYVEDLCKDIIPRDHTWVQS